MADRSMRITRHEDLIDPLPTRNCPSCGQALERMRRRPLDHLLSVIVPVARYECRNCAWSGLLRQRRDASSTDARS